MAGYKHEVLQQLWELEIRIQEGCPEGKRRLTETVEWLGAESHPDAEPMRTRLREVGRLCDTGQKEDAIREIRRAITEVKGWF